MKLKQLDFPLLYVIEFGLYLLLIAGAYVFMSFVGATPIDHLDLQGRALPPDWEAAVFNHGSYFEGYLISLHPFVFAGSLALVAGAATAIYSFRKAQAFQMEHVDAVAQSKHKIANMVIIFALAAVGYFVITHVVVSVRPV